MSYKDFYKIVKPSIPTDFLHFFFVSLPSFLLDTRVIFNCSVYSSLSLPYTFLAPPFQLVLSISSAPALGTQQKSSTLLFMAAGAEAGEVEPIMEYGDY